MLISVQAMPPEPPVQCNKNGCNLYNSYGVWGDRKDCHVQNVTYPTTEEELRLAVAYEIRTSSKSKLLRRLIDAVEEAGLSLVAAPYWEGVSVGGLVSTGAHGSSWWGKGGAVHDHIVGLSLIVPAKQSEGFAKIVKLEPKDQIFNAAKVSLGLLGVISRYDNRVPLNASGDGTYDFLGFQSNSILISKSIRATEKTMDNGRSLGGKCTMAASVLGNISSIKIGDFIRDVKKLRDLKPDNFCGVDIYNGFLIRFIRASEAYLGQPEDSVVVDFNYFRADDALTPRFNQDVWEEVEQLAFFKYGAKPHWAKNRNLAFLDVQKKYPNFNKFVAVKRQLDPQNLFSSGGLMRLYWERGCEE
ncbi:L-gulonolactone oxidase 3 [Prunus yedoensis var. nudiflora]|uniref:L-gulonolactone oxidase 3 n=1 Tax=Prunus yedoensis var. nudiflora TaxID=2094558 RepID=A0A314UCV8_PRUYE|nr:L-gulonolactone oxidase 3 [Prunus yedoensis var. nudiflora]